MPQAEVLARIQAWLEDLFTDPRAAVEYAESPSTSLAGFDLSTSDLTGANLRTAAGNLSTSSHIPADSRGTLHNFASSSSTGHSPVNDVASVTRAVHHNNPTVTNIFNDNRTFIDNSHNFVNNGVIAGDVTIDDHSATAIGAGAVAASGGANVVAATGAGSTAAQGSTVNQADHGSQVVDGSSIGQNQSNSAGAVQSGGDAHGVNTGVNTGVVSGEGTDHAVVGDGNHVTDVGGHADGSAFGTGASAASGNNVHDGAVAAGGDASNASHDAADHGAAIGGHDALGLNHESDQTNVLNSEDTNVAGDHSHAHSHQDVQHVDHHLDHTVVHEDVPVV